MTKMALADGTLKEPAHRVLVYAIPDGVSYCDVSADLSRINRRLYIQGMQYGISHIDYQFSGNPQALSTVGLQVHAAGDTWVVMNAWKKAMSVWTKQQRRTRRLIGQSAKPTWEDFKVYLDDGHRAGTTVAALAGDVGAVGAGEWDYSKLVFDDAGTTREPYLHIIGGDVGSTDRGLILAYEQSRATVQSEDPDLPAEYSTNLYATMADDIDIVADEVADNMEQENDEPPYDPNDYPGNNTNSDAPWLMGLGISSVGLPTGSISGFVAQCGLIRFELSATDPNGSDTTASTILAQVHLAPGKYQGVAALSMGQ